MKNDNNTKLMSQEYNKKIETTRKALIILKKDIQYRDQLVVRNQATYTLDAQIKGQFIQIDEEIATLEIMYQNIETKAQQLNIMQRDLDKRKQALQVNINEKNKLKRMYDQSLGRKIKNSRQAEQIENRQKFEQKYSTTNLSKEDHMALKERLEQQQQEHIQGLIGTVRQMKTGQGQIRKELDVHDGLLNNLQAGIDENMEGMSKVKRNMMKLLESSSYCCLIVVVILEIVGIICNLLFW